MGLDAILTRREYDAARLAFHGCIRKYLYGCRCPLCDTAANRRFAASLRPWRQA